MTHCYSVTPPPAQSEHIVFSVQPDGSADHRFFARRPGTSFRARDPEPGELARVADGPPGHQPVTLVSNASGSVVITVTKALTAWPKTPEAIEALMLEAVDAAAAEGKAAHIVAELNGRASG